MLAGTSAAVVAAAALSPFWSCARAMPTFDALTMRVPSALPAAAAAAPTDTARWKRTIAESSTWLGVSAAPCRMTPEHMYSARKTSE